MPIRARRVVAGALGLVLLTVGVAVAGVTWDPAASARVTNRPRTCAPAPCSNSAYSYLSSAPSFAVSNSGSTHYLHSAWFTDHNGKTGGGYMDYTTTCSPDCTGVYYVRSADGGATWTGGASADPVRLNPTSITSQRMSIAASGSYVYVAYVTTVGYWGSMCANSPRLLYVAVNDNHGAGTWSTVQLTSSGAVDFPAIAASGNNVYVSYTNSSGGRVFVARSTNNGSSFTSVPAGWTQNTFDNRQSPGTPKCSSPPSPTGLEGYDGGTTVAANGSTVGLGWVTTAGRAKAKVSVDGGASWPGNGDGAPCTVGSNLCSLHLSTAGALGPVSNNPATNRGTVSVAAGPDRLAFAWKDTGGTQVPKGIYVRTYATSGGWGPPRLISCLQTTASCAGAPAALVYNDAGPTSVALFGTAGIGVSWSACPYTPTTPAAPCNNQGSGSAQDPGSELLYKESWDGGATWWAGVSGSYQRTAANSAANSEVNEMPTLVFDKPGASSIGCAAGAQGPEVGCVRYIAFTGRTKNFFTYAEYLSLGTQT